MSHLGSWEHWSPPKRHYCCAHYAARSWSLIIWEVGVVGLGVSWVFWMFFGCLSYFFWMFFLLGASNLYVLVVGRVKRALWTQHRGMFWHAAVVFPRVSTKYVAGTSAMGPLLIQWWPNSVLWLLGNPRPIHLIIWDWKARTQVAFLWWSYWPNAFHARRLLSH